MVSLMQINIRCYLVFLALPLIVSACSKPDPVSVPILVRPPEMSGAWSLTGSGGLNIIFQASQSGAAFSGSCEISAGGSVISGSVHGYCTYPNITFTIVIPGYYDVRFSGQMIGETLVNGVLNGSGFSNLPMSGTRR